MKCPNMKRRRILQASIGILVTSISPNTVAMFSQISSTPIKITLDNILDIPSATVIGREAESLFSEQTTADLTLLLKKSVNEVFPKVIINSLNSFQKHLSKRVRDDFSCGDTVLVDGWVLSVTEARLSVLASRAGAEHILDIIDLN